MGVRLAFPPFTFDRDERVLRRAGRIVPLPPKTAHALALLLAEPGALVAKETLRDALWPEGFVEDGNLTQTIYVIRRALDPGGDGRAFVETIPRRGYRFVPEVAAEPPRTSRAVNRVAFAVRSLAAAAVIAVAFGGVSFGRATVQPVPALTGDAAREYALGRYTWSRRTEAGMRASIAHFGRVIALAPNDARGYAGLADTYAETGDWGFTRIVSKMDAYARAERYAREALKRDAHSGEALTTLGIVAMQRDHDLDRAEAYLRQGVAYAPNHGPAFEMFGIVRLDRGDAEGARVALRRATEIDPISPMNLVWYGRSLYYAHRFADAHAALGQLSDLDAISLGGMEPIVLTDIELGATGEARDALAKLVLPEHKKNYRNMLAAFIDVRSGRQPHGVDLRPRDGANVDAATAAALCLALGRRDDALAWLALSMRDREARATRGLLMLDPRLAALQDDPRFRSLIAG